MGELMLLVMGGVIWFLAWNRWKEKRKENLRRELDKLNGGDSGKPCQSWYDSN